MQRWAVSNTQFGPQSSSTNNVKLFAMAPVVVPALTIFTAAALENEAVTSTLPDRQVADLPSVSHVLVLIGLNIPNTVYP